MFSHASETYCTSINVRASATTANKLQMQVRALGTYNKVFRTGRFNIQVSVVDTNAEKLCLLSIVINRDQHCAMSYTNQASKQTCIVQAWQ